MICKKSCPIWIIVAVVLLLAAVAVTAFLVIKKLEMLNSGAVIDEPDFTEQPEVPEEGGVPYTSERDFV